MAGMADENHGWFAYSILIALAVGATLVPLALPQIARLFRKPRQQIRQAQAELSGESMTEAAKVAEDATVNTRYFTAIQLGALITLPVFLMIPLVNPSSGRSIWSSLSMIILCITTGIALVYVNRKGDLRWIRTVQQNGPESSVQARGDSP